MEHTIYVTKKSGKKAKLDIKKIKRIAEKAVLGLKNVSSEELIQESGLIFFDGMKTSEVQESLIKTAVSKIDVDRPDWSNVAARLSLFDLYHNVGKVLKTKKGEPYGNLERYFDYLASEGRLILGLKELYDINQLNKAIKPERDFQFNYLGFKTLAGRYLIKDLAGKVSELPQYLFMGVAMFVAQREGNTHLPKGETLPKNINVTEIQKYTRTRWAISFYNLLSKFEFMAATPTLSNARTPRSQLSSCFVTAVPDTIEGIFDMYQEQALLSKFGGGVGTDWSSIRGSSSTIDGHKGAAGGLVPFLKIDNDIALAVDQLGVRNGAFAVYTEPWHIDINSFLELKKTSGEDRRRTHDLFPALWLTDLFLERVESNQDWTLFDPYDVPGLKEAYGDEFYALYRQFEANPKIPKKTVRAKELWKTILKEYFETGSPFLAFKDTANRRNPNKHAGIIRSSNLCQEIFQNTSPNQYQVEITFDDGSKASYDESEYLTTDAGFSKKVSKLSVVDSLDGKQIYFIGKKVIEGETAVCNLGSINLSKINSNADIERVVPLAIRFLDAVIDLNFYPVKKAKDTNMKSRAIGLGVMGEAEYLATNKIMFGSSEHLFEIDRIMEKISYTAIQSSSILAKEKGAYPNFKNSDWDKGIFPMDHALTNKNVIELIDRPTSCDWESLKAQVHEDGLRNGYIMAIAPTASISILTGTSQAIEPVFKKKWFEENLSGLIPVVAPNLSAETWNFYPTAYEVDQQKIIHAGAIRQKWIDQGQSLNFFITLDKVSGKYLNDIYMNAWKFGLKSTYYLRSMSPEIIDDPAIEDRSQECIGCQ